MKLNLFKAIVGVIHHFFSLRTNNSYCVVIATKVNPEVKKSNFKKETNRNIFKLLNKISKRFKASVANKIKIDANNETILKFTYFFFLFKELKMKLHKLQCTSKKNQANLQRKKDKAGEFKTAKNKHENIIIEGTPQSTNENVDFLNFSCNKIRIMKLMDFYADDISEFLFKARNQNFIEFENRLGIEEKGSGQEIIDKIAVNGVTVDSLDLIERDNYKSFAISVIYEDFDGYSLPTNIRKSICIIQQTTSDHLLYNKYNFERGFKLTQIILISIYTIDILFFRLEKCLVEEIGLKNKQSHTFSNPFEIFSNTYKEYQKIFKMLSKHLIPIHIPTKHFLFLKNDLSSYKKNKNLSYQHKEFYKKVINKIEENMMETIENMDNDIYFATEIENSEDQVDEGLFEYTRILVNFINKYQKFNFDIFKDKKIKKKLEKVGKENIKKLEKNLKIFIEICENMEIKTCRSFYLYKTYYVYMMHCDFFLFLLYFFFTIQEWDFS